MSGYNIIWYNHNLDILNIALVIFGHNIFQFFFCKRVQSCVLFYHCMCIMSNIVKVINVNRENQVNLTI